MESHTGRASGDTGTFPESTSAVGSPEHHESRAKAFAADGPSFPVPIDLDIGKGRAGGGVKQLVTRLNLGEHRGGP